jgi:ribose transport system permease protein
MKTLKKLNNPYLPAIIGTVALLILGQCLSKGFLSMNNISSILMTTSILTLASIGQAAVIISGDSGLDMSVGAIMSMTALFGPMINVGSGVASFILMIPAVMLMGAVVGAINGTGVQMLKVVPLVMTLIMSNVVDGFSIMVTKGQPSVMVGKELQGISKTLVGPLRILPTVVIIILILLEILFLRRSRYGRSLFLAGNNRNAANLCGINSKKIIILAYVFGGAMAGFTGLMLVGYAGTAQMNMASKLYDAFCCSSSYWWNQTDRWKRYIYWRCSWCFGAGTYYKYSSGIKYGRRIKIADPGNYSDRDSDDEQQST